MLFVCDIDRGLFEPKEVSSQKDKVSEHILTVI